MHAGMQTLQDPDRVARLLAPAPSGVVLGFFGFRLVVRLANMAPTSSPQHAMVSVSAGCLRRVCPEMGGIDVAGEEQEL